MSTNEEQTSSTSAPAQDVKGKGKAADVEPAQGHDMSMDETSESEESGAEEVSLRPLFWEKEELERRALLV